MLADWEPACKNAHEILLSIVVNKSHFKILIYCNAIIASSKKHGGRTSIFNEFIAEIALIYNIIF
jgi:hypothetical protein